MKESKISLRGDNIYINMDNGSIIDITISITSHNTIPWAIYIYELITGYVERRSIYDKPRIELHSRGILSELEKHFPCVKRIDRRGMPNVQIYPKNVDVHYEADKDTIIIAVKYSDKYNPLDLFSSDRSVWSNRSKLCDLLQNLFRINSTHDNAKDEEATFKFSKDLKELKKEINSVFGVPTFEAFDKITDELKDTYIKKNHDYGNSFDKSIDKFGLTAAVVRMNDKMERLSSLLNKDAKVDESIRDTVMDLANYCIITAMYLDNKKENK